MKTLRLQTILAVGVIAAACACGSSSSGGGTGSGSSSGGSGSGSGSSSGGGTLPTISISMPTAGAMVTVTTSGTMKTAPIAFATTNFTLMAPGTCPAPASSDNCGHVHVYIDGAACTPEGSPYDNAATSSPADAILSTCPMVDGSHDVLLELHHDDHSPIKDSTGKTVSATVTFTAAG